MQKREEILSDEERQSSPFTARLKAGDQLFYSAAFVEIAASVSCSYSVSTAINLKTFVTLNTFTYMNNTNSYIALKGERERKNKQSFYIAVSLTLHAF